MAERFAANRGVRVRYLTTATATAAGGADLYPVVLVPGITDFADEYAEAFEVFSPRRLVVVEMRGRGGSDAPPAGYSAADQAGDVMAVLDAEGIRRFHLMTFSRGTTPALEVALARPASVVTLSIGDYPAAEIALPDSFVDAQWGSRWRGRSMPERVGRHVLEAIQAESVHRDLHDQVASLGVPVMVVRGMEGGILSPERIKAYESTIPGVEIVGLDGSGHDLFRPDRRAYPRAVAEFIARRAPAT